MHQPVAEREIPYGHYLAGKDQSQPTYAVPASRRAVDLTGYGYSQGKGDGRQNGGGGHSGDSTSYGYLKGLTGGLDCANQDGDYTYSSSRNLSQYKSAGDIRNDRNVG